MSTPAHASEALERAKIRLKELILGKGGVTTKEALAEADILIDSIESAFLPFVPVFGPDNKVGYRNPERHLIVWVGELKRFTPVRTEELPED